MALQHWIYLFFLSEGWNMDVTVTQLWQFNRDNTLENVRTMGWKEPGLLNDFMEYSYLPALNHLLSLNITWEKYTLSCLSHYILRSLSLSSNTYTSKLFYNICILLNNDTMMQWENCLFYPWPESYLFTRKAMPLAKSTIFFFLFPSFLSAKDFRNIFHLIFTITL